MRPSTARPLRPEPPSSFGSVDWLSQSSCTRPAAASSCKGSSRPGQAASTGEAPQTTGLKGAKSMDLTVQEMPAAGLSKAPEPWRGPRVRTAFSTEQLRALEGVFRHHQYLGPLERKKLAREMRLSEVQIKTWFQNRRMKHKRQMQDSQLAIPFSGPLPSRPALCALFHPEQWPAAAVPVGAPAGAQALVLPPGSCWGLCQAEQDPLALAWASWCRQPLMCRVPGPGSHTRALGPALSTGPWGLRALPETGDAF
ncbi:homeobox protein VENTX [Microcebus murinus]|uniref:homeobox protein VENTX n=1 Tax=Microcebus murinus TaxID=30608 RepID=UPI003F6C5A6F